MARQDAVALAIRVFASTAELRSSMKEMQGIIGTTTAAVNKLAQGLNGEQLTRKAATITEAIKQIGGATKLTAAEAARLEPTLARAIEKMRLLGQTAPAEMVKTQQALKAIAAQGNQTAASFGNIAAQARSFLGLFGIGIGVGSLIAGVRGIANQAGQILDLAAKLGVSAEAIQRWTFAAKQSGVSMDQIGASITQMANRVTDGSAGVSNALKRLGIELYAARAMRPEDLFNSIVRAIVAIPDPMQQINIAMELFGRQGADILPALKQGFDDLARSATVAAEEQLKAIDRLADKGEEFLDRLKTKAMAGVGAVASFFEAGGFRSATGNAISAGTGDSRGQTEESALAEMRASILNVESAFARMIPQIKSADAAMKEFAPEAARAAKHLEDTTKAAEAAKRAEEAYQKFKREALRGMSDANAQTIAFLERLGREEGFVAQARESARLGIFRQIDALNQYIDAVRRASDAMPMSDAQSLPGALDTRQLRARQLGLFAMLGPGLRPFEAGDQGDARFQRERNLQMADALGIAAQAAGRLSQSLTGASRVVAEFGADMLGAASDALRLGSAMTTMQTSAMATMAVMGAVTGMIAQHEALIAEYRAEINRLSDAIEALGGEPVEAVGTFTAQIAALRTQLFELEHWTEFIQDGIGDMQEALELFGGSAPAALQPLIQAALQSGALTEDLQEMFEGLAEGPSWEVLAEAAERYGLSLDALGQQFHQLRSNDVFDQLFADWTSFGDIGADINAVLEAMAPQINAALRTAQQFGIRVPEYMRPVVDAMSNAGLLAEDIDLSQVEFDESIVSSLQQLEAVLLDILAALQALGGVGLEGFANRAKSAMDILRSVDARGGELGPVYGRGYQPFPVGANMPGIVPAVSPIHAGAVQMGPASFSARIEVPVYLNDREIARAVTDVARQIDRG